MGSLVPRVLRQAQDDDSEDNYVVGVRETRDPGSWTMLFMEYVDVGDPQDAATGMDTYCLVVDPGQATHYGGVRECAVVDHHLRLVLTDEAASTLGIPVAHTFDLDLPAHELETLRYGLWRVLSSGRSDAVPIEMQLSAGQE